jgi:hypothetical protein
MEFKVVPFMAQITRSDTSARVARQMQAIIDDSTTQGWEYMRTDSVQTTINADRGCFGIGARPAFITTYTVLVFKK